MPANLKEKVTNSVKLELEGLEKENAKLKKEVAELKKRGDHEIIVDGEHYFVNFKELLDTFDHIARGSIRQPGLHGAVGAHNSVAKILSLGEGDKFHEGVQRAQQLLLKYAGGNQ